MLTVFSVAPIVAYVRGRPTAVLGLVYVAGSFSAVTVPIAGSNLRLEMVAVPLLASLVIWRERRTVIALLQTLRLPFTLVGIYVLANVASSAAFAPAPLESLKIALWLALSVAACFVAAALTSNRDSVINLGPWIVAGAVIQVAVGAVAVLSEALFATYWGVMSRDVLLGKAIGLSWEANILSINIAIALPFLLWPPPEWNLSRAPRIALLAFLSLGLGLAYSRGGFWAFFVGAVCALVLSEWRPRIRGLLEQNARFKAIQIAGVVLIGIGAMQGLAIAGERIASARNVLVVNNDPLASPPPGPKPGWVSAYRYVGTGDTIAVRLRNMSVAVAEVVRSPLIGLGTDSYRQRHLEPSCGCPAFVNNLPVATLYESGTVGLVGLAGFLVSVVAVGWRRRAWPYLAAVVAMLVGYQFTDAIWFGSNWVLMGTVLGFAGMPRAVGPQDGASGSDDSKTETSPGVEWPAEH